MKPIAHIKTDFGSKFGVPRQSGMIDKLVGEIIMEPEYRVREAFRGLEEFSHIWLLWDFSESHREEWSPTVRPPMLGGNTRMGVFATRSPFRPNNIGLSSVKLIGIKYDDPEGPILIVEGADLMNGTPIYDIKPYLPFTDSHPEAKGGFTEDILKNFEPLEVIVPDNLKEVLTPQKIDSLIEILKNDPRPQYHADKDRVYGLEYCGINIRFQVEGSTVIVYPL